MDYNTEEDMLKLGLDVSDKIILYAYKASGSCATDANTESKVQATWSSTTARDYIYILQKDITNGEELDAYYINTGALLNGAKRIAKYDPANVEIHVKQPFWGSKNAKPSYKIRVKHSWKEGMLTKYRYEFYTRDESGNNDLSTAKCYQSGMSFYNTVITSNGIIKCDTLNANNGYFAGSINSDGYFNGELNCNKGSLNNVGIKNAEINGALFFNCGATLYAFDKDKKRYLNISPYTVGDKSEKEYPNASYYRYIKNSNGNNNGKMYYAGEDSSSTISLVDIMVPSGSVVTIPQLKLSVWRYIPTARNGKEGSVTVSYILNNSSKQLVKASLSSQSKGSTTVTGTSSTVTATANTDCRLTIFIKYNIHLPTYYWLGADKAAASITLESVNSNNSEITIEPADAINNGFVIGKDGFMVRCGSYGLKVTSSGGIQKYDSSKNGWTSL